jgi:hypothetical protein
MTNKKKLGLCLILVLISTGGKYVTAGYIIYQLVLHGFAESFISYYLLLILLLFACFKLQKSLEELALSYITIEPDSNEEKQ